MRHVLSAAVFLLVSPIVLAQSFHHHLMLGAGQDSPCASKTFEPIALNNMQRVNWPVGHGPDVDGKTAQEAQDYFNQGMTEYYGFNYEAAMRSFRKAKSLDPGMAMASWGIALAAGPNINLGMDDACRKVAMQESACAVELTNFGDPQYALVKALALRYAGPFTETVAYSVAMKRVWETTTVARANKGPDVANVGALYAESMLDMRPWGLFDAAYRPALDTDTINTVLNTAMKAETDAIGANHLYIHAIEASAFPRCGLESADVLIRRTHTSGGALQKEAPGHLVHMPSHIYLRLGDYARAMTLNSEAVDADRSQYEAVCADGTKNPACPQLYYGHYLSHNLFFRAVAATFTGQSKQALLWARETGTHAGRFVASEPGLQRYMTAPLMTLVMNRQWQEIIDEPAPPAKCPPYTENRCHILTAMWHWARGMAFTEKDADRNLAKASTEYKLMADEMAAIQAEGPKGWGNNSAEAMLAVAQSTLQAHYTWAGGQCRTLGVCGENAGTGSNAIEPCKGYRSYCGEPDCPALAQAIEHLKLAVTHEDALVYDEPPQWFSPAREALGGAYLRMAQLASRDGKVDGKTANDFYEMARIVFEEELERHPGSGRALYGRMRALAKASDPQPGTPALVAFCNAWGTADYDMGEDRLWPDGQLTLDDYSVHCKPQPFVPPPMPDKPPDCACNAQACPK